MSLSETEANIVKAAMEWEAAEKHWLAGGVNHTSDAGALSRTEAVLLRAVKAHREAISTNKRIEASLD